MIYDFLLVGHGLAGSILAHTLAQHGFTILVIDEPKANSASNVAAGLINPLAGKRFAKSWLADTFVPFAAEFYQTLENQFNRKLFHQKPILKLFSSVEEQNNWMGKSAGAVYNDFIKTVYTGLPVSENIKQEQGGIEINKGGYVEVPVLLAQLRLLRLSRNEMLSGTFDFADFRLTDDLIFYKELSAKHIIFSEGFKGAENPYFSWLPFSLNKGEVLDFSYTGFPQEHIYNKAVYVLGIEANVLRVGATYNWREVNETPTEAGLQELSAKLADLVKKPFTVVGHKAGIRPAVRDRRPLIGTHPAYERVKIFNGMGSKGVMMAPFLAHHFTQVLAQQEELMPEVNILRYLSLYQEHN